MAVYEPRVARALAAPARAAILRHLEEVGTPQTVENVATVVGLHVNTVRSHLDVLADVGLVRRDGERRSGPGRPRVLYVACGDRPGAAEPANPAAGAPEPAGRTAAGGGAGPLTGGFRELAELLAGELAASATNPAGAAMQVGERWAAELERAGWQAPATGSAADDPAADDTAKVVSLLGRLGFAPETEPLGDRIYLHACPFAGSARQNPAVLCGVHLGLLRGMFARLGGRVAVTGCDAFARDDLCVIHLEKAGPKAAA